MTVLKKPLKLPLVVELLQPLLGQLSVLVSPGGAKDGQTQNQNHHLTPACLHPHLSRLMLKSELAQYTTNTAIETSV